jgi:hypothetical protein
MRALLVAITALLLTAPARARDAAEMMAEIVALATAPDTLMLNPEAMLKRLAFRGGTPKRGPFRAPFAALATATGVSYWLVDKPDAEYYDTFAEIDLSNKDAGWRAELIVLYFRDDDNLLLTPLGEQLTKAFGAPSDRTPFLQGTPGNTLLRWRGSDRYVEVGADVPGAAENLRVYDVEIYPR